MRSTAQKVSAIQSRLKRECEEIRANRNLTDSARRRQLAVATVRARREAAELKAKLIAAREERRESLQRRLFGLGGTPKSEELMLMRDSVDRAAKLESPEEAQLKLKLAAGIGDSFMAKAVAQVAAAKGWRDVLESYAENAPLGTKTALEELANIPSGRNTNLADTAMFNVRAPQEFIGMRDNVIEALARDELDYAQGSQQADPNSVYIEQLEAS